MWMAHSCNHYSTIYFYVDNQLHVYNHRWIYTPSNEYISLFITLSLAKEFTSEALYRLSQYYHLHSDSHIISMPAIFLDL